MVYLEFSFYIFVVGLAAVYYLMPKKIRWMVLLLGSIGFYVHMQQDPKNLMVFGASIFCSYFMGLVLDLTAEKHRILRKFWLTAGILGAALPLLGFKLSGLLLSSGLPGGSVSWIVPLGLAFYTMAEIAYLSDIYLKKNKAERNPLKFTLFVSFFPLILQGPIHRYSDLAPKLFEGHALEGKNLQKGFQLILWGFFLKMVIADNAAVVVNTIFLDPIQYSGFYLWEAAILYSVQLYTDFQSCVMLSRGVCWLFGIQAMNNFNRPYFSPSIKEFWRNWHISLSTWLRDYIYIPLGGSRKGKFRKYINLILTFLISGLWHGSGLNFLAWGLLHGCYQIVGDLTFPIRDRIYNKLGMPQESLRRRAIQSLGVFFLVTTGWVIFRTPQLSEGLELLKSMFTASNYHILFDGGLFEVGLRQKEFQVLNFGIFLLIAVGIAQRWGSVSDRLSRQIIVVRYAVYYILIISVWIFGAYGLGFSAQDFIYGGF